MQKKINRLENHYIICGFGRMGKIIARSEETSSKSKLLSAGANRVILPYEIGGFRIYIAGECRHINFNTIIVGIYRASGELIYNPKSETDLQAGDNLIVIGERNELEKLQGIASG